MGREYGYAELDYQEIAFGWASRQDANVGLLVLATGMLYAFYGYRFFGFLLGLSTGVLGWMLGYVISILFDLPAWIMQASLAALFTVLSTTRRRWAVLAVCGGSWALLGYYLATQLHLPGYVPLAVFCQAALLGVLFAHLSYRPMTVVLTTLQGTVLMIIGFVGASMKWAPSFGLTFRDWAGDQSLLVPILLTMLFVTAYSFQANAQRGSIVTGA